MTLKDRRLVTLKEIESMTLTYEVDYRYHETMSGEFTTRYLFPDNDLLNELPTGTFDLHVKSINRTFHNMVIYSVNEIIYNYNSGGKYLFKFNIEPLQSNLP